MGSNNFAWAATTAKKNNRRRHDPKCAPRQAPQARSKMCAAGDKNCTYGQAGEEKDINSRV
jgi:hypothetical protein